MIESSQPSEPENFKSAGKPNRESPSPSSSTTGQSDCQRYAKLPPLPPPHQAAIQALLAALPQPQGALQGALNSSASVLFVFMLVRWVRGCFLRSGKASDSAWPSGGKSGQNRVAPTAGTCGSIRWLAAGRSTKCAGDRHRSIDSE